MITGHFPLSIGEEVARSERALLARMEDGEWMQSPFSVRFLVLHCSATRCNRSYTVEQMMRDHKARGFRTIGYHFYIRRDGTMTQHRRLLEVGAHARPYNRCSIGICYEGGLDENGKSAKRLSSWSCTNFSLRQRSWDIVTCLALRQRIALAWMRQSCLVIAYPRGRGIWLSDGRCYGSSKYSTMRLTCLRL